MLSRTLARRVASATAATALLAAAGLTGASAATAASYEQVNRTTGTLSSAPLFTALAPLAVTDNGRYSLYRVFPTGTGNTVPTASVYVRDSLLDTTRVLTTGTVRTIFGIDNAGKYALALRSEPTGSQSLVLAPIAGGTAKTLVTSTEEFVGAAISGDGKTVAYSTGGAASGIWRLTVATGAKQKVGSAVVELGTRSLSDNGQVIAGKTVSTLGGVYYRGTAKTTTPDRTIVSPNGAIVATLIDETKLVARRLSDGYTRTYDLPADYTDVAWISPDGLQVAINANRFADPVVPARVLNLVTGSWSPLGGPYAKAVDGSALLGANASAIGPGFTAISRSGRYVVTRSAEQPSASPLVVADLTGGDLPGVEGPNTAGSYVAVGGPTASCWEDGNPIRTSVFYQQPQSFVGNPRRLEVTIKVGSTTLATQVFTNPQPGANVEAVVPNGTTDVTYVVKVVDAAGRSLSTTDTAKVSTCG